MLKSHKIQREHPRLSLCMIAKNEARFLRKCLQSVQGIVDEIVLVDTGSTDGTQEIAREFGATLIEQEWNDDFSEARNVSLRHATGDWVLWLDADEEIAPEARDGFRKTIEKAPAKVGAYLVQIQNWMSTLNREDGGERIAHHAARLFRRTPEARFVGRIHEQNLPSLLQAGYEVVPAPHLVLDHYGYVSEIRDEKKKNERTIRLLTREVSECPIPEMFGFQCFNLGLAYSVVGDNENAAKYFAMAAAKPDAGQQHTDLLFAMYAMVQKDRGLPEEGLRLCRQADALGVTQPGLEFARGHCLRELQRLEEAVTAFHAALRLGADPAREQANVGDVGLGRFKARFALAVTLNELNRLPEALAECERTLAECETMMSAHGLRADLLARLERLPEAQTALRRALEFQPENAELRNGLGLVLLADGQAAEALPYLQQAAETFPENSDVLVRLACAYETLDRLPESEALYRKLCVVTPRSSEIHVNLGRVLARQSQTGDALNCFADAIEINPHDANAFFNTGDLLYQIAQYPQAQESYQAGLNLRPDYGAGWFTLGNACFQMGDYSAAASAYRQALELEPDHNSARLNLELTQERSAIAA